jgi:hypothetical protein
MGQDCRKLLSPRMKGVGEEMAVVRVDNTCQILALVRFGINIPVGQAMGSALPPAVAIRPAIPSILAKTARWVQVPIL